MAKVMNMKSVAMKEVFKTVPHLVKFPSQHIWVDFDKEADVLYISFEKPQMATDSELLENNVLLRYRKDKLVGVTIIGTRSFLLNK